MGFAFVFHQHCSTGTSIKTAILSMNSSSSRLAICTASGTDAFVMFSSPLNGFFFKRDSNCFRFQPTNRSQLVLQTRDVCCKKLLSTNLSTSSATHSTFFASFGALLNHVVGCAMPSMFFTATFTICSSPDNILTNSTCHNLQSSGCACIKSRSSRRCLPRTACIHTAMSSGIRSTHHLTVRLRKIVTQIHRCHVDHVTMTQSIPCGILHGVLSISESHRPCRCL